MTAPKAHRRTAVALAFWLIASLPVRAGDTDELVTTAHYPDGSPVPYVLTLDQPQPAFVVILMPGGVGVVGPEIRQDKLVMRAKGNFLIRSRGLFGEADFAAVSTDATSSPERMTALLDDLARRFPKAAVYIIGTSRSTYATMRLAESLDGRHLIVHHRNDTCRVTGYASAASSHERYGTELLTMEGGITEGDPCEAFAHHGYNGIERETVEKIKAWIRR